MNDNQKVVALVGMCGSGKSEVADCFIRADFDYLRLGQITLDEVKKRGLEPKEENERPIREGFRQQYGKAAFAILNFPKIDALLAKGENVICDGLYSWSEYKEFKKKYDKKFRVVSVFTPPEIRYQRLTNRRQKYKDDPKMKYRSFSFEEAKSRDYSEIENIEKGGPIAMADYTIVNVLALDDLKKCTNYIINQIKNEE
ncbi:AAA family ATPase [Patescibacteria group bacterium]|nr:AAA family ATPase [Patescibacteria group bacterium]MBU0964241.1 AAA family ATPase [Patescibacteria group bacterium]